MQNTSTLFKKKIKEASRQFQCKVTIGDRIYNNEDVVDIIIEHPQPTDGFTIGNTPSKTLDLTILNKGDTIYSANQVKVEIGINTGTTIEYILMGYFNIDDIEKTDYTTKITSYDNMIKFETPYFSNLTYPATLQQVVNELAAKTGVQFIGSLPSYTVKKLEGFTCREVLGFVAGVCGGNAAITREGKFTVIVPREIDYSIDPSNYFDSIKLEETKYKVGKITCKAEDKELSKGSLGTDSMEIQFENPWVTENILQDLYNKLNGFSYLGYSMKWQGDISLDYGDIVSITDKKGVTRKVPILSQKFNYTGGLTAEIGAKGETKNKNSYNSSGDNSKKLERVVTELAIVNKALIDVAHINDADITNLRAKDAEIQNALIEKADVKDLKATNANIDKLYASDAVINKALIGKADIIDLNAVKADINILDADVGNIKTLTAGNISAENIQTEFLQTLKGWMLEGSIGNAQISDLNANKLRSGTVDTSLVTVAGPQGRLKLQGNKLQVFDSKDNALYERIMLGIDENNNSALVLRGTDGKTVLLNQDGLTKAGFTDGYNKIDNNSLDGSKLDINSVVRKVNGATEKIESTVVNVGNKTLNVLLQEQNNNITEHGKSLSTHESRITANEKAINLKVDSQTYSQDKTTINKSIETTLTNSKAYADAKKQEAIDVAENVALEKSNQAKKYAEDVAIAKANLAKTEAIANADGKIDVEEKARIKQAQDNLNTAISKADKAKQDAVLEANRVAELKKQEAISSASTDATTKANNAKDTAISEAQKKADKALNDSKTYVNQEITTVNSNLSKATSEISVLKGQISLKVEQGDIDKTVTTQINNLEVGGRNLLKRSNQISILGSDFPNATIREPNKIEIVQNGLFNAYEWLQGYLSIPCLELLNTVGETFSFGIDIKTTGLAVSGCNIYVQFRKNGVVMSQCMMPMPPNKNGCWFRLNSVIENKDSSSNQILISISTNGVDVNANGVIIEYRNFKLEKGNKPTAWTPAPEDVNQLVADVITTTETKISNAKSEIKAETDKIKLSVTGLDSKTKTIETQLGDKATKSEIKAVSDKASSIEANLNGITQRVSSTESKISTVEITAKEANDKIDGLEIGGRNFLLNSGESFVVTGPTNEGVQRIHELSSYLLSNPILVKNKYVTMSVDIKTTNFTQDEDTPLLFMSWWVNKNEDMYMGDGITLQKNSDGFVRYTKTQLIKDKPMTDTMITTDIYNITGTIELKNFKLEIGNKATDWTPAQEDVDQAISAVNETVTNKFSEITSTTERITQRVSSVEDTTNKINGKVANQEQRLKEAETKITDNAIINTVKDAKTDGKATFATTSSVEQLSHQVNFKFDSLGVTNILSNSNFANRDCTGWTLIDICTYDPNPEVFMPYEGWRAFNMIGGENRGLLAQPDIKKDRIPQRNTKYTFSLSSITEGNIEYIGLYLDYKLNGRYVYNQQIPLKTGANYNRYSISFTTPNGDYDYFMFYIEIKRKSGTSGYTVFSIGLPCLSRGDNTSYTARENEVVSGNTKIDANGVEIYNGALTVKNKNGQNMIVADSNGDLTISGRLQPYDNTLRLFGDKCTLGGGAGALRLAYDNLRYVSIGADNRFVMYTALTPASGNKYFYILENPDGHTTISNTRSTMKLLGGPDPCIQSRWGSDSGYAPMAASDWRTGSSKYTKTNITPANTDNMVNMIKNNHVRNYQLKAELEQHGYDDGTTLLASDVAMKTGLVIEELTPEARYMLTPNNADTIDLYSMVSTLWAGTQSCINKIEQQQEEINNQANHIEDLQKQIDELKSLVIKN